MFWQSLDGLGGTLEKSHLPPREKTNHFCSLWDLSLRKTLLILTISVKWWSLPLADQEEGKLHQLVLPTQCMRKRFYWVFCMKCRFLHERVQNNIFKWWVPYFHLMILLRHLAYQTHNFNLMAEILESSKVFKEENQGENPQLLILLFLLSSMQRNKITQAAAHSNFVIAGNEFYLPRTVLPFPNTCGYPGHAGNSDKILTSYSAVGSNIHGKYLFSRWLERFPFSISVISMFCRFTNIFCFNLWHLFYCDSEQ